MAGMTPERAVQEHVMAALMNIRNAEEVSLTLNTDVDHIATAHVSRSLADAAYALSGAFYALVALENSMAGKP